MANIPLLTLTGTTWSTFGDMASAVNTVIGRVNTLGESSSVYITGGTVDGTPIGSVTPSTGAFTNLTVDTTLTLTGASIVLSNDSISGDAIDGGTITADYIELNYAPTTSNHATTKAYVDSSVSALQTQIIAYSMIFGG